MRIMFLAPSLLALSACVSPQQQCLDQVTRDLIVVNRLIAVTEGNLARGYAVTERQRLRNTLRACNDDDKAGDGFNSFCRGVVSTTRQVPVAIDITTERAKLEQLRARQAALIPVVEAQVSSCRERYPEA